MGKRFLPAGCVPELLSGRWEKGLPQPLSPCPAHRDGDPQGCEGLWVPLPRQANLLPLDWELSKISLLQAPSWLPRAISQPGSLPARLQHPQRLKLAVPLGVPRGRLFPSAHSSHHTRRSAFTLMQ